MFQLAQTSNRNVQEFISGKWEIWEIRVIREMRYLGNRKSGKYIIWAEALSVQTNRKKL